MSAGGAAAGDIAQGLAAEGLCAGYGDAKVLSDLSLQVAPGEMVAVLGRNGAGKTTALMAIAGLVPTDSGTVRVGGADLTRASPGARVAAGLVSVPDDRGLFPSLSVAEHFSLVGSSVDEAAETFPALAGLAGRRVGACSGGEQQQVAVGLGMVRRPKVLMVDELSMGLAPQVAAELLAGLRALADAGETAVVVVEQFVDAVLAVADRGLVLSEGRVTRDEPAAALLADRGALEAAYLG